MENVLTTTALWQDFDPNLEPLDSNVLKTEEFDGLIMKSVYYTGHTVGDGKTRVLGKVCYKNNLKQKHAVLLIGNYKKPISESELIYWANNGFVAMAIDYAGRRTKGACTLYPSSLDFCNSDVANGYFYVGENAKQNKIYEYALNSMRAVTYLLSDEKVSEVSVVTYKKGVAVGVVVLGMDTRITNGTVVFGSLYREYPQGNTVNLSANVDSAALAKRLEYESKSQIWTAGIAPQSYAMQSKVPIYLVVSADSPYVSLIETCKMYNRLNDQSRLLIVPMTVDYLSEEYVQSIVKWCKGTSGDELDLQPTTVNGADNYVKLSTKVAASKITLWYSRNPDTRARNWVKAPLKKTEDGYIAELDVYEPNCTLVAYAIVKNAVHTTSTMCEVKVQKPTKVKIPTRSLYASNSEETLVPLVRKGGWHGSENQVEICKGYLDIYGAKGTCLATFCVNDPCVRRHEIFTVSFDVCCETQQTLSVIAMTHFGARNTIYTQNVQLSGDGKWQRVTVEGTKFHSEDGRFMSDEAKVEVLAFDAATPFLINNIFLV